jgi:hypothetical protein
VARAVALYEAYLDSLPVRRTHGDRAFPHEAISQLASALQGPVPWRSAHPAAAEACALSWTAARLCPWRPMGEALAWAGLMWPVGRLLGPALLASLGGVALWAEAPASHRAAVFAGRLPGVPARARGILLRVEERWDGTGPLGLAGRRVGIGALCLAAAARAVAPAWLHPREEAGPLSPLEGRLLRRAQELAKGLPAAQGLVFTHIVS